MQILSWMVLLAGACSLSTAVYLGWLFFKLDWEVSYDLAREKMVDACTCLATMAFSINAFWTGDNDVDMLVAHALRFTIFLPSLIVSWILIRRLKRIKKTKEYVSAGQKLSAVSGDEPLDEFVDKLLVDLSVMRRKYQERQVRDGQEE